MAERRASADLLVALRFGSGAILLAGLGLVLPLWGAGLIAFAVLAAGEAWTATLDRGIGAPDPHPLFEPQLPRAWPLRPFQEIRGAPERVIEQRAKRPVFDHALQPGLVEEA